MLCVATVTMTSCPPAHDPFVLVVDDYETSLRNLQAVLESAGYSCVARCCPAEALAFCATRRPSLVVTDLTMPRIDGYALARRLGARYPGLPIVLVTGTFLDAPTQAAFRDTFAGVFAKPLAVEAFLAQVARLLPPDDGPRPAIERR